MNNKAEKLQKAKVLMAKKLETKKVESMDLRLHEPPTSENRGIREIMEVIDFLEAFTETAIELSIDGIGILDLVSLLRDDEILATAGPALKGATNIPAEVADLSSNEIKTLATRLWDFGWALWDTLTDF